MEKSVASKGNSVEEKRTEIFTRNSQEIHQKFTKKFTKEFAAQCPNKSTQSLTEKIAENCPARNKIHAAKYSLALRGVLSTMSRIGDAGCEDGVDGIPGRRSDGW